MSLIINSQTICPCLKIWRISKKTHPLFNVGFSSLFLRWISPSSTVIKNLDPPLNSSRKSPVNGRGEWLHPWLRGCPSDSTGCWVLVSCGLVPNLGSDDPTTQVRDDRKVLSYEGVGTTTQFYLRDHILLDSSRSRRRRRRRREHMSVLLRSIRLSTPCKRNNSSVS